MLLLAPLALFASEALAEPTKQDVRAELERVRPQLDACAASADVRGKLVVEVTIRPSGRVRARNLHRGFEGSEVVECVLDVTRTLRFEAFDGERLRFKYPIHVVGADGATAGGLDHAAQLEVRAEHEAAIRACGGGEGKRGGWVGFRVEADGRVSVVGLDAPQLEGSAAGECVRETVAQMQFPSHDGVPIAIHWHFVVE